MPATPELTRRRNVGATLRSAAAALALTGCAALPPARMALPEGLAALQPVDVAGLGGGRSGEFSVGPQRRRFERGADQARWFDRLETDKTDSRYTLALAGGGSAEVGCKARQARVVAGVLDVPVRPYGVTCLWRAGAELTLAATRHATLQERIGSWRGGGTTLELRSVHRVQGSALSLAAPIGYLLLAGGRPVGAVEHNGSVPRLWRPDAASPLHGPVTEAALALALLWDPASR